MKEIIVLIIAAAFILSATSFCLSVYEFYGGIITEISGNKVTVKYDKGGEGKCLHVSPHSSPIDEAA
jgi:hypothetical protein